MEQGRLHCGNGIRIEIQWMSYFSKGKRVVGISGRRNNIYKNNEVRETTMHSRSSKSSETEVQTKGLIDGQDQTDEGQSCKCT